MSLSNIASVAVLPPLNLLLVALAGAAAAWWRRAGAVVAAVALLTVLVLAMPSVADTMMAALETGLPLAPDPAFPPQAIVLLGGDVARIAGGGSDIGPLSLERVRTAARLARRTGLPILVSGGVTNELGAPVCAVMADSLDEDFHQPARWRECRSPDTWENAALSAPMLRADGVGSVYVVTHGWHMRRSLLAFVPTGLHTVAAPTALDAGPDRWGWVPTAGGLHRSFYAIHEWVGIAWYRWRLR